LDPRGTHAASYPPVILFDDVVQVGTISNQDGIAPTVIEFVIHAHAPQSGMGRLEDIQGNYSRLAVALECFTEEGLGGGDVQVIITSSVGIPSLL